MELFTDEMTSWAPRPSERVVEARGGARWGHGGAITIVMIYMTIIKGRKTREKEKRRRQVEIMNVC